MIFWRVVVCVVAFVVFGVMVCAVRWRLVEARYRKAALMERYRTLRERIRTTQAALQRLLRPERLRESAQKAALTQPQGAER